MQDQATHASGHVFCVERMRGPQSYCKYRAAGRRDSIPEESSAKPFIPSNEPREPGA